MASREDMLVGSYARLKLDWFGKQVDFVVPILRIDKTFINGYSYSVGDGLTIMAGTFEEGNFPGWFRVSSEYDRFHALYTTLSYEVCPDAASSVKFRMGTGSSVYYLQSRNSAPIDIIHDINAWTPNYVEGTSGVITLYAALGDPDTASSQVVALPVIGQPAPVNFGRKSNSRSAFNEVSAARVVGMAVVVDKIGQCLPVQINRDIHYQWSIIPSVIQTGLFQARETTRDLPGVYTDTNCNIYGSFGGAKRAQYLNWVDAWFRDAVYRVDGPGIPIEPEEPEPEPEPGPDTPGPYPENPDSGDGGTGEGGGGDGGKTEPDDPVKPPSVPTVDVKGLSTTWKMSQTAISDFAKFLWSDALSLDSLKKLFRDPMDMLMSFHAIRAPAIVGESKVVTYGGVEAKNAGQPIYGNPLTNRYCRQTFKLRRPIPEMWGSYMDYAPYTSLQLYLPYCGSFDLDPDLVLSRKNFSTGEWIIKHDLSIEYTIDCVTGQCVAALIRDADTANEYCILQQFGNMSSQIPLTGESWARIVGAIAATVTTTTRGSMIGGKLANQGFQDNSIPDIPAIAGSAAILLGGPVVGAAVGGTMSAAAGMTKPVQQLSGSFGSNSGILGIQQPYIVMKYPDVLTPKDEKKYYGYPLYQNVLLGSISGYTEVDSIHLSISGASREELDELEKILKGGVVF